MEKKKKSKTTPDNPPRKLFVPRRHIHVQTAHHAVRFQAGAERHDAREVDLVQGQVEMEERGGLGEELGEGDRARGGECGLGEEESFECGVERKSCAEGLDLWGCIMSE